MSIRGGDLLQWVPLGFHVKEILIDCQYFFIEATHAHAELCFVPMYGDLSVCIYNAKSLNAPLRE